MKLVALVLLLAGCTSALPVPSASSVASVRPATPIPTPTGSATALPSASPFKAPSSKPYQEAFGAFGSYNGLDALPLVAGHKYKVEWSYDASGGVCGLFAGLQGTGSSVLIQLVREAAEGGTPSGSATFTMKPENGTDPRLVVVSECLWVITIREVR